MKKIIVTALSLIMSTGLWAQGAHDFKISEVYVATRLCNSNQQPDSAMQTDCCAAKPESYADEYGDHPSWIEIQNTSYSTHDIRSCYLTNRRDVLNQDLSAPERIAMMSLIPKGDTRTNLAAKERITFFADGHVNRGTLHTSFTLAPGDFIALYDGNGVTLLDSLTLPDLKPGCSYARIYDAQTDTYKWVTAQGDEITPNAPNNIGNDKEDKIEEWKKQDPHGIAMAVISMSIVFACLILLYVFFHIFGWALNRISLLNRVKTIKALHEQAERIVVMAKDGSETKGIEMENYAAAIGLALHEYLGGTHDVESGVITIEHHHTDWESKEHMLRHTPNVHHNA